jgi:outer membrane lipoprotein SlyB
MRTRSLFAVLAATSLVAACAQPLGPTVQVLPPPGKPFAAFQAEQHDCSIYTNEQVRPLVDRAASAALGSAALGAALGAGLGAAVGGGRGAGIGAASGAIVGTAAGGDQYAQSQARLQMLYDNTYASCMVARGDVLPPPPAQQVVVMPQPILVQPAPYLLQPVPGVQQ